MIAIKQIATNRLFIGISVSSVNKREQEDASSFIDTGHFPDLILLGPKDVARGKLMRSMRWISRRRADGPIGPDDLFMVPREP